MENFKEMFKKKEKITPFLEYTLMEKENMEFWQLIHFNIKDRLKTTYFMGLENWK